MDFWDGREASIRVRPLMTLAALWAGVILVGAITPNSASGSSGSSERVRVEMRGYLGFDGLVPLTSRTALHLEITSSEDQRVTVSVHDPANDEFDSFEQETGAKASVRLELRGGRTAQVDLALRGAVGEVSVRVESGGEVVPGGSLRLSAEGAERLYGEDLLRVVEPRIVVGAGASFGVSRQNVSTVGGIQPAVLLPLSQWWDRPGALDSMSGVVLSDDDVDSLTDDQRSRLREWVAMGGNLAIDGPRSDLLPIIDVAAQPGSRTAVGVGWVRFTDGIAASGAWANVIEPASVADAPPTAAQESWASAEDPVVVYDSYSEIPLVDRERFPLWILGTVLAVSALLAGPVAGTILRRKGRAPLMWVVVPAISVGMTLLLLLLGRVAFGQSVTRLNSVGVATPWSFVGDGRLGVSGARPPLEVDVHTGLVPVADAGVERSSDGWRAVLDRGANDGVVRVERAKLTAGPPVSIDAMALNAHSARVTVRNRSEARLLDVALTTTGRFVDLGEVPPGDELTRTVELSIEPRARGAVMAVRHPRCFRDDEGVNTLFTDGDVGCLDEYLDPLPIVTPASTAIVQLSGRFEGRSRLADEVSASFISFAPVRAVGTDGPVRVDVVGPSPLADALADDGDVAASSFSFGPDEGASSFSFDPDSSAPVPDRRSSARITATSDVAVVECRTHWTIGSLQILDGDAGWVDLAVLEPEARTADGVRRFGVPSLLAGDSRFLRYASARSTDPAVGIECGAPR